jgi:hypothetical protein
VLFHGRVAAADQVGAFLVRHLPDRSTSSA